LPLHGGEKSQISESCSFIKSPEKSGREPGGITLALSEKLFATIRETGRSPAAAGAVAWAGDRVGHGTGRFAWPTIQSEDRTVEILELRWTIATPRLQLPK